MKSIKEYKAFIDVSSECGEEGCREHFWTERTFGGYRIANIPFYSEQVSYGDIVRIDETTGEILSVVHPSGNRNGRIVYVIDPAEGVQGQFQNVRLPLEKHGIQMEGIEQGSASLAVPEEITEEQFRDIIKQIPQITSAEITLK